MAGEYGRMEGWTRMALGFVALNAFAGAAALLLFPADTASGWFWTVAPPINAGMFGALYLAAGLLVAWAAVRGLWEPARFLGPMVPAFTGMMLLTTVLHLDRFQPGTRLAYWLLVYAVALAAGVAAYARHEGRGATWRVVSAEVGRRTRTAAVVAGALAAAFALVGYAAPGVIVAAWPWEISPLMVRVFVSWLVAFAAGLLWFGREPDWQRIRPVAVLLLLTAVLLALVLVAHRGDLGGEILRAWAFAAYVGAIGLLGAWMLWSHRGLRASAGAEAA